MTSLTRRGATVELAVSAALEALNATRDEVKITVIEEGRKGFLGFGAKEAEVSVTKIIAEEPSVQETHPVSSANQPIQRAEAAANQPSETSSAPVVQATEIIAEEEKPDGHFSIERAMEETKLYIQSIAQEMKIEDLQIEQQRSGKYLIFQLESEKAAILIGKRGQTLNALQQLAQLVANKYADQFQIVRIDIGDYRERREQSLQQLADRMADKAVRNGRKVQLEPMPSHERKVIHHTLSSRLDIETYSEGSEPYRYLVIEPIR